MKKIAIILLVLMSFVSCKNETKQEANLEENRAKSYDQNDGFITMKGEFVYDADQNAAGYLELYNPSSTTFIKHWMSQSSNAQFG